MARRSIDEGLEAVITEARDRLRERRNVLLEAADRAREAVERLEAASEDDAR